MSGARDGDVSRQEPRWQTVRPLRHRVRVAALSVVTIALITAGCTDNAARTPRSATDPRALAVAATDTACTVSGASAPSGRLTFTVTNAGSSINEFYLLASDGLRIVGEVENIGPGITRDLVLTAPAGDYFAACKPGMVGEGIRSPFSVVESGATTDGSSDQQLVDAATTSYAAYVRDQAQQLLDKTGRFAKAYTAGDDATARELYPRARLHWERIETVAESFGDLDPKMDLREADLEAGQRWTGWHRLEKDLWPPSSGGQTALTGAERRGYVADLLKNTQILERRLRSTTYTVDQISNGSRGLLDEVAKNKVTGEEERWSHTDLYDFQGNVDGARVGYEGVRMLLRARDPQLDTTLQQRFTALQGLLDQHRSGSGFARYDQVSTSDVKALSNAVNALSEPLSRLTATIS